MSLIRTWFGWPDGSVLTNLVASLLWAVPVFATVGWRLLRSLRRLHRRVDELHAKHDRLFKL